MACRYCGAGVFFKVCLSCRKKHQEKARKKRRVKAKEFRKHNKFW